VKSVLDPTLVPAPFSGHDLLLELVDEREDAVCAGDSVALGMGYVPRLPKETLMRYTAAQRRELPAFPYQPTECQLGKLGPLSSMFNEVVVDGENLPSELYVQSREMAVEPEAGWADRTDHIQWLPIDLINFDKRVAAAHNGNQKAPSKGKKEQQSSNQQQATTTATVPKTQSSSSVTLSAQHQAEAAVIDAKISELSRCVILDEDPMGFLKNSKKEGSLKASAGGDAGITVDGLSAEGECVEPYVEIKHKLRVHLVPLDHPPQGVRFSHLIQQGLAKHPAVELVDYPQSILNSSKVWADLVLYLPTSTRRPPYFPKPNEVNVEQKKQPMPPTMLTDEEARKRLVVLDEGDGNGFFPPVKDAYMSYFKRSWPHRKNGKAVG
jgi:hypothetical protein